MLQRRFFPLWLVMILGCMLSFHIWKSKTYNQSSRLSPSFGHAQRVLEEDSVFYITAPTERTAFEALEFKNKKLASDSILQNGTYAFSLLRLDSNQILTETNAHQSLVPASIMKVVTTGVALALMGENYRFKTYLQYDGEFDSLNGILHGNVYIKGGGDPTLGSSVFQRYPNLVVSQWKNAIKNMGIDSITGKIIADASYFEYNMTPAGWAWGDMQNGYGVGASGLSFSENTCEVVVKRWKNGNSVSIYTIPRMDWLDIKNTMAIQLSGVKNHAFILGSPYGTEYFLKGAIDKNTNEFHDRIPIPDPPFLAASLLYKALKKDSILVADSVSTIRKLLVTNKLEKKKRTTFYTIYSPPLKTLIQHTNMVSQNFYAETILKALAKFKGMYGSTENGVRVVKEYLAEHGVDLRGFYMTDGSGLSRFDGVTTNQFVRILQVFAKDSTHFETFYNSLPVAGQTGTLRKIGKETIVDGNLRAKSGTMSRVKSYAGYLKDEGGRPLAFAMISNNHHTRASEITKHFEEIMILMAKLE